MSERTKPRKLRRFFTSQTLGHVPHDLWLDPAETHHLRDSIRLKPGDACLVTDGQGGEAEASVGEFSADGRACLQIQKILVQKNSLKDIVTLRVFPAMLRRGKTDLLIEKAQELGVHEFHPVVSEHCEVKIAKEKSGKIVERWNRIAREASKQSGNLTILRIEAPKHFKRTVESLSFEEPVVIFHPGPDSIPFPQWLHEVQDLRGKPNSPSKNSKVNWTSPGNLLSKENSPNANQFPRDGNWGNPDYHNGRENKSQDRCQDKMKALNLFIGPEGGFSEEEIRWVQWYRKGKNLRLVELGQVLLKADTAFIGIVASLRLSGILSA